VTARIAQDYSHPLTHTHSPSPSLSPSPSPSLSVSVCLSLSLSLYDRQASLGLVTLVY